MTVAAAALAPNSGIPAGYRRPRAEDADDEARTLYVNRPLTNAADLLVWARKAGFAQTLPQGDVHVTIAFSKEPVQWSDIEPKEDDVSVPAGGRGRVIERLGDKGAVVLRFESSALTKRWHQFRGIGASWDWPGYKPHVTITYDVGDLDLSGIEPYDGPLDFGPEVFAEVDSDWADKAKAKLAAGDSALRMALDKDSVRTFDRDGRMKIARTHISKANVCPYKGSEIPGWEELGLEPDRVYQLFRDPEELKKAAPTLNGVQLLRKHVPVNADDHQPDEVVGSLGTDAEFDGEYLDNSLFVNTREAIKGIESNKKRELSAGYHYTPDMTPGIFRGKAFDGVMRDIEFNHVALVEDGRAGPDVVVGDSTENLMSKPTRLAALTLSMVAAHAAPLLALDKKLELPKDLFTPITSKNFKEHKSKLLAGVKQAMDGKLRKGMAFDESGLAKLIDALEDTGTAVDEPASKEVIEKMDDVASVEPIAEAVAEKKPAGFDAEPVKAWMRSHGATDEEINGMFPQPATDEFPPKKKEGEKEEGAEDEDDDEEAKAKKAEEEKKAKDAAMTKDMVTKPAMDAAIDAATKATEKRVRATEQGIRTALVEIKPWVGELPGTLAFDSAEGVYRHAATMLGIKNAKTLHADALLPVIQAQPQPGARPVQHDAPLGLDEATVSSFTKRFPGSERIGAA